MFDAVSLSCDDSHFLDFWPIVSRAWQKFFPEVEVLITVATQDVKRTKNIEEHLARWGNSKSCPCVVHYDGPIPMQRVGKILRHLRIAYAAQNLQYMTYDMDLIPLQRENFVERFSRIREDKTKLYCSGKEVYDARANKNVHGKCPICGMVGTPEIFAKLFQTKEQTLQEELAVSHKKYAQPSIDGKENILDPRAANFSDESLVRLLRQQTGIDLHNIPLGYHLRKDRVDRIGWLKNFDPDRLRKNEYVDCHMPRELSPDNFTKKIKPILEYLDIGHLQRKDLTCL